MIHVNPTCAHAGSAQTFPENRAQALDAQLPGHHGAYARSEASAQSCFKSYFHNLLNLCNFIL